MEYKVLITASGTGSRLGELTKYTNKSLVRVGKKPALSYIVENYPDDVELVVTLGYYGNHVRDFLELAYPNKKFNFVYVDKYEGEGTSLGYSMLSAKEHLNCPFIYHASDTIVKGPILPPKHNWNGGYKGDDSNSYASFEIIDGEMRKILSKGALNFDYLHIGLVGINDYEEFWQTLDKLYKENSNNSALNDCQTINSLINQGKKFQVVEFDNWYDVGNTQGLMSARKRINDKFNILDKVDESIYIFNDFVIKFFNNTEINRKRAERAEYLKGLVPDIFGVKDNFYKYNFVKGDLFSEAARPDEFEKFLSWAQENLWLENKEVSDEEFLKICYDFYYNKTKKRLEKFWLDNGIEDSEDVINGVKVPKISDIFEKIDWEDLCRGTQTLFHGDFILDNILKTEDGFSLLDWRQDFGGLTKAGDKYYDLSKLNHNLTVNHDIVHRDLYEIKISGGQVECDIMRKQNLVECQAVFHNFLRREGYDIKKVKILTAIIWLNMSPLHHHPFNLFLYYFGKLNLWKALNPEK